MNKTKNRNPVWAAFSLACVWFGYHVGPAFSSGAISMNYYLCYGIKCFFFPVITYGIAAIFLYYGMRVAYVFKSTDYDQYMRVLYPNKWKLVQPIWTGNQVISAIASLSSTLAFGASVLNMWLGMDMILGRILVALLSFLIAVKGLELVSKTSTFFTIALVITVLFTAGVMLVTQNEVIVERFVTGWSPTGVTDIPTSLRKSTVFGFSAMAGIVKMSNFSGYIRNKKECTLFGVFSFLIAIVGVFSIMIIMLPYGEELYGVGTPIVFEMKEYISKIFPWLYPVYTIVLIGDVFNTAPVVLLNELKRWENSRFFFPENTKIKNMKVRQFLIFVVLTVFTFTISLLGFDTIVNVFFQYFGYVTMPMTAIPILLAIPRVRKYETEHPND